MWDLNAPFELAEAAASLVDVGAIRNTMNEIGYLTARNFAVGSELNYRFGAARQEIDALLQAAGQTLLRAAKVASRDQLAPAREVFKAMLDVTEQAEKYRDHGARLLDLSFQITGQLSSFVNATALLKAVKDFERALQSGSQAISVAPYVGPAIGLGLGAMALAKLIQGRREVAVEQPPFVTMGGSDDWWSAGADSPATLKQDASGPAVADLQTRLNAQGCAAGVPDGQFGPGTAKAVRVFQGAHGLTPDGIMGPSSWAALQIVEAPSHVVDQSVKLPAKAPAIKADDSTKFRKVLSAASTAINAANNYVEGSKQGAFSSLIPGTGLLEAALPAHPLTPDSVIAAWRGSVRMARQTFAQLTNDVAQAEQDPAFANKWIGVAHALISQLKDIRFTADIEDLVHNFETLVVELAHTIVRVAEAVEQGLEEGAELVNKGMHAPFWVWAGVGLVTAIAVVAVVKSTPGL